jgi:alkylhydroperoxidase family enzyme
MKYFRRQTFLEFSMFLNWNEYRSGLLATIGKFAKLQPEFMKGFQQMDKGASENKHLDPKTHELIALAVAVTTRCDGCLAVMWTLRLSTVPRAKRSPKRWPLPLT